MILWYLLFGIGFGIILQRSHICFVSAMSDPQITGSTEIFRSILIGILTSSLGITIIKYLSNGTLDLLGVSTISIPLMLGAFLFGIGMMLAGTCASGMFIRLSEGHMVHLFTISSVIIGYLIGTKHYTTLWSNFIVDAPVIFLPHEIGWSAGIGSNILIILLLYMVARKYEPSTNISYQSNYLYGAICLGILNVLHFLVLKSTWSITGAFFWFGELSNLKGDSLIAALGPNLRNLGLFLGAFLSVLVCKKFHLQKIRSCKQILEAVIGGLLMGYGACIAGGCNISAFFISAASLSLSAWVFLIFLFMGSFVGIKILYKLL